MEPTTRVPTAGSTQRGSQHLQHTQEREIHKKSTRWPFQPLQPFRPLSAGPARSLWRKHFGSRITRPSRPCPHPLKVPSPLRNRGVVVWGKHKSRLLRGQQRCEPGSCPAGWLGPSSAAPTSTHSPTSKRGWAYRSGEALKRDLQLVTKSSACPHGVAMAPQRFSPG